MNLSHEWIRMGAYVISEVAAAGLIAALFGYTLWKWEREVGESKQNAKHKLSNTK